MLTIVFVALLFCNFNFMLQSGRLDDLAAQFVSSYGMDDNDDGIDDDYPYLLVFPAVSVMFMLVANFVARRRRAFLFREEGIELAEPQATDRTPEEVGNPEEIV